MNKAQNVIEYYVLCNKLKKIIRTGWKDWNVKCDRLESVAEHIYGTQMLAIAMHSEYQYDIDIKKVITMLALHELEEITIGDLTLFQITEQEKQIKGHKAIHQMLKNLYSKDIIEQLIIEFDECKTKEAVFAFFCDKLEADIQSKLYDEQWCVDLNDQSSNMTLSNPQVQEILKTCKSWSEMWSMFSRQRYNYDQNFTEVSNYITNNKIQNSQE